MEKKKPVEVITDNIQEINIRTSGGDVSIKGENMDGEHLFTVAFDRLSEEGRKREEFLLENEKQSVPFPAFDSLESFTEKMMELTEGFTEKWRARNEDFLAAQFDKVAGALGGALTLDNLAGSLGDLVESNEVAAPSSEPKIQAKAVPAKKGPAHPQDHPAK